MTSVVQGWGNWNSLENTEQKDTPAVGYCSENTSTNDAVESTL